MVKDVSDCNRYSITKSQGILPHLRYGQKVNSGLILFEDDEDLASVRLDDASVNKSKICKNEFMDPPDIHVIEEIDRSIYSVEEEERKRLRLPRMFISWEKLSKKTDDATTRPRFRRTSKDFTCDSQTLKDSNTTSSPDRNFTEPSAIDTIMVVPFPGVSITPNTMELALNL